LEPETGSTKRWVRPLRAALGSLMGSAIGALAGNPVAIVVGAAVGALASGLESGSDTLDRDPSARLGSCALCGDLGELEPCGSCGRAVCASCRQLVMSREERRGRSVFRHYERRVSEPERDLPFPPLRNVFPGRSTRFEPHRDRTEPEVGIPFPPLQSVYPGRNNDLGPPEGFQVGEEAFILTQDGELVPWEESGVQFLSGTAVSAGGNPASGWCFDGASYHGGQEDWPGSDQWDASDWDEESGHAGASHEPGCEPSEEGGEL